MSNQFLIISAVRNEAEFLGQTAESLCRQTLQPARWVLVDDGSKDQTFEIASQFAASHPWIQVIRRKDRGFRQSGVGVVEAFYEGFHAAGPVAWDYVMKLDGDVRLPANYLSGLVAEFDKDPRLGIASGDLFNEEPDGRMKLDSPTDPAFHVRGAAKAYRRACWTAIGGMPSVTGFDCVDNVKARMLGWDTRRFAELKAIHLRRTGEANGSWKNGVKDGMGANAIGYHPLFLVLKCFKRFAAGPGRLNAIGQFFGFLKGYRAPMPRIQDPELIRYLRQQQINRILGRETIWK